MARAIHREGIGGGGQQGLVLPGAVVYRRMGTAGAGQSTYK